MVTILGAGVAGASLAWALARRGRRDVVVFDPSAEPAGSTSKALGGFRTQHGSERDRRLWVMGPGDQHDWNRIREWLSMRAPRAEVLEPDGFISGNYEVTFDHHPLVGETARGGDLTQL
jgi:choline dehydrogenase-like flavoprotein